MIISIKWQIYNVLSSILQIAKLILESVLCLLLSFQRRSKKWQYGSVPDSIIIPLMHGLGDAIIFSLCLRELILIFPETSITCITTDRTKDILKNDFSSLCYLKISSIHQLRKFRNHYDLMIFPARNIDHYLVAFLLNPKFIIGYNYNLKILKGESHIQRAVRILKEFKWQQWQLPFLSASEDVITQMKKQIHNYWGDSNKLNVTLIIGGRWRSKTYKPEYYFKLIYDILSIYKVNILLIGTGDSPKIEYDNHSKSILNLINKTNIHELMGIIHLSDLIIGPDGGVLNLAMAMRKRIVGIFSSVDPGTIVPESYSDMIIFEKQCPFQPCYNEEHEPFCPFDDPPCIDLEPRIIFKKIEKQLELISDEKS